MASDKLNRWIILIANIGVIAGLALVAYEINQTRVGLEIAATADSTDDFVSSVFALVHDPELSALMHRAETTYSELNDHEKWKLSKYLDGFFNMAQQDFFVIRDVDERNLSAYAFDWRERMVLPLYHHYWERRSNRYHPEFTHFIEQSMNSEKDHQEIEK